VIRTKYKLNGSIGKHKARLVVKGFAQVEGIDHEETNCTYYQDNYNQNNFVYCNSIRIATCKCIKQIEEKVNMKQFKINRREGEPPQII
jgi:hypothetical protein